MTQQLFVRTLDGAVRTQPLEGTRLALGRASSNELCFPEDAGLSRQHLVIEKRGQEWMVRDLGSKNGTLVNGDRLEQALVLKPGDIISAGHLTLSYAQPFLDADRTVMFVDPRERPSSVTLTTRLEEALTGPVFAGERRIRALIRAGRELAGRQPLADLFPTILDLAIDAAGASRGVLMTLEGDRLETRASRGEGFQISGTVRDQVIREKASLLVRDTRLEEAFRLRLSIVAQSVRSMLAVPLQAGDRVIGLIYVDSSSQITDFTAEDLSLLTVMANVAAIRIEHARLAEVEEAELALAHDLEQAAEIQRQILPGAPPQLPGFDLAGYNSPCRAVGGDYYDFHLHEDGHVWLVLGDVAGKGMPAALMVASLQARLQVLFEETTSPAALVTRLNRLVAANCPSNRFITFFAGTLDPATGGFTYCNAGHNPPLVMRSSGTVERLTDGGLILGILPQAVYQESACTLAPGDALVLFSDGVTEATGAAGEEEFGEERLAALIRDGMAGPACEMVAAVTAAVAQWGGAAPAADDITLVVARRILPLPPE